MAQPCYKVQNHMWPSRQKTGQWCWDEKKKSKHSSLHLVSNLRWLNDSGFCFHLASPSHALCLLSVKHLLFSVLPQWSESSPERGLISAHSRHSKHQLQNQKNKTAATLSSTLIKMLIFCRGELHFAFVQSKHLPSLHVLSRLNKEETNTCLFEMCLSAQNAAHWHSQESRFHAGTLVLRLSSSNMARVWCSFPYFSSTVLVQQFSGG